MMLIVRSCHLTAVFLARMVMPFSARVARVHHPVGQLLVAVKEPVWRSIASTSVVFPWSTWR